MMNNHLEISQVVEVLRHPDDEAGLSQHLAECLECRSDLIAVETLRALALEAAPQPRQKLLDRTLYAIEKEN